MRRGKLNNKAYLLIIVAAIFTIFSYLFDQMVINFENKNRILDLIIIISKQILNPTNLLQNN